MQDDGGHAARREPVPAASGTGTAPGWRCPAVARRRHLNELARGERRGRFIQARGRKLPADGLQVPVATATRRGWKGVGWNDSLAQAAGRCMGEVLRRGLGRAGLSSSATVPRAFSAPVGSSSCLKWTYTSRLACEGDRTAFDEALRAPLAFVAAIALAQAKGRVRWAAVCSSGVFEVVGFGDAKAWPRLRAGSQPFSEPGVSKPKTRKRGGTQRPAVARPVCADAGSSEEVCAGRGGLALKLGGSWNSIVPQFAGRGRPAARDADERPPRDGSQSLKTAEVRDALRRFEGEAEAIGRRRIQPALELSAGFDAAACGMCSSPRPRSLSLRAVEAAESFFACGARPGKSRASRSGKSQPEVPTKRRGGL